MLNIWMVAHFGASQIVRVRRSGQNLWPMYRIKLVAADSEVVRRTAGQHAQNICIPTEGEKNESEDCCYLLQ